ncbi:MAG TPA: hypothetical protein VEA63_02720, partial [Opitutus sp.]|nr:hypothetical protein [Opitutus sp.]
MARPTPPRPRSRPIAGDDNLAAQLRRLVADAPNDQPLPTTRALAELFGVANTTVFRLLRGLAAAGEIWQHPTNGRYYSSEA